MLYTISPISSADRKSVIDILNYYVEHGFAAYPETPLPYEFFDLLMKAAEGYPTVAAKSNRVRLWHSDCCVLTIRFPLSPPRPRSVIL